MLFNRTTFNKLAETERLTLIFLKCQMRKRRPLDWLVITHFDYLYFTDYTENLIEMENILNLHSIYNPHIIEHIL